MENGKLIQNQIIAELLTQSIRTHLEHATVPRRTDKTRAGLTAVSEEI